MGSSAVRLVHEAREDALPERLEALRVAEELGHLDEDVVVQGLRFGGGLPEVLGIRLEVVDPLQEHAPSDAAPDAGRLVLGEIDAGGAAQDAKDSAEVGAVFLPEPESTADGRASLT